MLHTHTGIDSKVLQYFQNYHELPDKKHPCWRDKAGLLGASVATGKVHSEILQHVLQQAAGEKVLRQLLSGILGKPSRWFPR
jgi:hypothetical protein